MPQINLIITTEFEKNLKQYMRYNKIRKKSQAIRQALKDAVEKTKKKTFTDFRDWRGLGLKTPLNSNPRFKKDEDLW
jgi:hypothetical protein